MTAYDYLCVIRCPHEVPDLETCIAAVDTSSICSLMTNTMQLRQSCSKVWPDSDPKSSPQACARHWLTSPESRQRTCFWGDSTYILAKLSSATGPFYIHRSLQEQQ